MSFLSPNFLIGEIRIGSVEGASCVNMGNNFPIGFENHTKLNQGFGSITGDANHISDVSSLLNDSAFIDMLTNPNDEHDIPDWIKPIITAKLRQREA